MKLYELPRGSKIKATIIQDGKDPRETMLTFKTVDGMYSVVTIDDDPDGGIVHLGVTTELEERGTARDRYYMIKGERDADK